MSTLGLDIGGANIKVANLTGYAQSFPFPLWKRSTELANQLAACLRAAPRFSRVAVTMTGELCDCYATKAIGVNANTWATRMPGMP